MEKCLRPVANDDINDEMKSYINEPREDDKIHPLDIQSVATSSPWVFCQFLRKGLECLKNTHLRIQRFHVRSHAK